MKFFTSARAALILCAVAFNPALGRAQLHREWVKTYSGNPAGINQAVTAAFSPDGDLVVAGSSANGNGDQDYLIIKYAPNGDERWRRRYDTLGQDQLRGMAIDTNGNITVTGTSTTVRFDKYNNLIWDAGYAGRALAVDSKFVYVTGYSEVDFSLVKIDAIEGTNIWAQLFNGPANGPEHSSVVALDSAGNAAISGFEVVQITPLQARVETVKYSPSASIVWQNRFEPGYGAYDVVAIQTVGEDVYITGNDPLPAYGYLTIKYGADGTTRWSYKSVLDPVDPFYGEVHAMAVNANGDVYLTGQEAINDTGDWNWRTLKIASSGTRQWMADYHGNPPGVNQGSGIALDSAGNCYVTGSSPGQATANDFTTIMYDANGRQLWADRYDGVAHGDDFGTAVVVDKVGNVYVTGYSTTPEGGTEFVTIKYSPDARIQQKPGGAMNIQFLTNPNADYILQGTTNFFDWTNLLTNTADANGFVQFDDTQAPSIPLRFYRGKTPP